MKIIVLSDGETFDVLDNCKIVDIPDGIIEDTDAIELFLRTMREDGK
jgi:hypothetical protein